MENLLFKSINGFEVDIRDTSKVTKISRTDAMDVTQSLNETNSSNTKDILTSIETDTSDYCIGVGTGVTNFIWTGTIVFSFVVWITCIVSLILNIVRKNVGKAVFSGVGLILPLVSIFIATMGRTIQEINEGENSIGMFLAIFALIMQVVVEILAFIFCFSKKKNEKV